MVTYSLYPTSEEKIGEVLLNRNDEDDIII